MSTPQFYNIGKGKRIEIKVCNEDSIQIRRVRCLLYYSNSGKKECIGKYGFPLSLATKPAIFV